MSRLEIKQTAKAAFQSHYGLSLAAFALMTLLSTAVPGLATLFLAPVMTVCYSSFCVQCYLGHRPSIGAMFEAGFSSYWRNLGGILWMQLFIFLWSLLFVIPGLIKSYAYFCAPYLLAEYPGMEATDAIKISMQMTRGFKFDIFVMQLSFFLWAILSSFTLGILLFLFVGPYMSTSLAGQYLQIKENALAKGWIHENQLNGTIS